MKIGFAAPINCSSLKARFNLTEQIPSTFEFPLTTDIAEEYVRQGHQVTVFALSYDVKKPFRLDTPNLSFRICPFRPLKRRMLDGLSKEIKWLRSEMEDADVDVIHAHWTYEFALAALESKRPCLVTAHDAPWRIVREVKFSHKPYRIMMALMAARVLMRARWLTCVSPYMQQQISHYWPSRTDAKVVPNGIRLPTTASDARHTNDCIIYAVAGDLADKRKNSRATLDAFGIVQKALPNAKLWVFGTHEKSRKLLSHYNNVECFPPLDQAAFLKQLSQADILVHSALEESFGMLVLEAMALGMPVIGGDHSGAIPWLLDNGTAGVLTNIKNPVVLSNAMYELGSNLEKRRSLSVIGKERAANFSLKNAANIYIRLLTEIVE